MILSRGVLSKDGISKVYGDISDFFTLWKEPNPEPKAETYSICGVYKDLNEALWIDGGWVAYGSYEVNDRNERVEEAQSRYPGALIHNCASKTNWLLVG